MKWPAMFAALALASAGHATAAQPATAYGESPWASLNDDATLRYWQGRYSPNIRINFDTLLSHLSARERVVVKRSLLRIGTRDPRDPLAYYALLSPASIHLSTLSIKFLDDIAIASAWLAKHEYSIESVPYYSAVLKYRDTFRFPGHRYQRPLTTLGIPDDALADAFVDDVSQKTLKGPSCSSWPMRSRACCMKTPRRAPQRCASGGRPRRTPSRWKCSGEWARLPPAWRRCSSLPHTWTAVAETFRTTQPGGNT